MKIENISNGKVIGIGEVTVLPGETKEIPADYERNPLLSVYQRCGLARIIGEAAAEEKTTEQPVVERAAEEKTAEQLAAERAAAEKAAAEEAEALRQARLASLDGISEEDLGRLANELGIHPAECKDQADVLKKVKAALKK